MPQTTAQHMYSMWYHLFKNWWFGQKMDRTETMRAGRMMKDSHGLITSLACPVVILMPPLQTAVLTVFCSKEKELKEQNKQMTK